MSNTRQTRQRYMGQATPLDSLQVLVIGGGGLDGLHSYSNWRSLQAQVTDSVFPLSLFCANDYDVRAFSPLRRFICAITHLDREEQLRRIDEIATFDSCNYHMTRSNDVKPFLEGPAKTEYRRTESLAQAIKAALLEGRDLALHTQYAADYEAFTESVSRIQITQSPAASPSPVLSATVSSSHVPAPQTYTNASQAHAGSPAETAHQEPPRVVTIPEDNNVQAVGPMTRRRTRTHTQDTNAGGLSSSARHRVHAVNNRRVFWNQRDSHGNIRAALYEPPPKPTTRVPSLGRRFNRFADAWGFDDLLIGSIHTAVRASSDVEQFVVAIAHELSDQEARWVWEEIDPPVGHSSRIRKFNRF
ncbi:hypothetical protein BDW22DRAFT_1428564 [Trametopsis cervina]|nr:hypothetical protein BDW22DRAFT_1428564 [Trametopsis cervina]